MLGKMGCENVAVVESSIPLHEKHQDDFPVTRNLTYLNHAAVAPLCRPAANAIRELADDASLFGSLHYDKWMETYDSLRKAASRLINASPDEIAIVKNTSEGISMVAEGFHWREGDRVVAFLEEFPSNYYPWLRLERRGIKTSWLSIYDPIETIAAAAEGARLLAVSYVNYLSGFRVDLESIGSACHQSGCFFLVDAIQGLGAFPLDVERCHIDALAADGHKWLLGPEGNGILYVRRQFLDAIEPVEFGWTNPANYADYSSRDMTLRPDAGRYECGTLNTVGCFGLRAALEFLLEIGIENIAQAVSATTGRLAHGLEAKGYELMVKRTSENGSGIVTFRHPGLDARQIVSNLKRERILAAPRQGWVRMSPHFYIAPQEIDRVLEVLPDAR